MVSVYSFSALLIAYLFGSIPTAVWLGQAFYGVDVREYGSGNAGATNTFSVLGKKAGIAVMTIDISKGYTATNWLTLIGMSVTGPRNSARFCQLSTCTWCNCRNGTFISCFCRF